jgi:hypothetical protein
MEAPPPPGGALHANMMGEFGHTAITELWVPIVVGSHAFAAFWLFRAWRLNRPGGGCRGARESGSGSASSSRSAWKLLSPPSQWPGRRGRRGSAAAAATADVAAAPPPAKGGVVVVEDDCVIEAGSDRDTEGRLDQEEVRGLGRAGRARGGHGARHVSRAAAWITPRGRLRAGAAARPPRPLRRRPCMRQGSERGACGVPNRISRRRQLPGLRSRARVRARAHAATDVPSTTRA